MENSRWSVRRSVRGSVQLRLRIMCVQSVNGGEV